MFRIIKTDEKTKARLGVLTTPHGVVNTPSYVFVGTYGKFRHLKSTDIKRTQTQLIIANTFHLWNQVPKQFSISNFQFPKNQTFLTKRLGLNIPTMTDSGGFQVLSLAFGDKNKVSKFTPLEVASPRSGGLASVTRARLLTGFMTGQPGEYKRTRVRITSKGVYFRYDGKKLFLGPKLSMKLQSRIGADITFAFDHITSPHDSFKYNKKAVELTNKWARTCLKEHEKMSLLRQGFGGPRQMLFGIVQGGIYPKLREKSAKYIGSLPFDGFGIGGSYTKKQISEILKWVIPHLPEDKPRHLLGVGKIADIFEAIENGVDTFDCVIPTREARHGKLYTKTGNIDIRKGKYAKDGKIIERGCGCLTCSKKITRARIRGLIKNDDRKLNAAGQPVRRAQGERWCLLHNMWFFNNLLKDIRNSIAKDKFLEFKDTYLSQLA